MTRRVVGLDLNGVWDHVATATSPVHGVRQDDVSDVGPRSVVVRADAAPGVGVRSMPLLGGPHAPSMVYGRGREFGPAGAPTRRRETADAWLELRAGSEDVPSDLASSSLLVRDAAGGEGAAIDADAVLLAGARSAIRYREGQRTNVAHAGFCIPDDLETTEAVQARLIDALGRSALGGTRLHLVWDSVAVALSALHELGSVRPCPSLPDPLPVLEEDMCLGVVISYANDCRTHVFRLKKDGETGRLLPVRKGPAEGRPWPTGWGWCLERLGLLLPFDYVEKVKRQTRALEHWGRGGSAVAWIRDVTGGWIQVSHPKSPVILDRPPHEAVLGIEDVVAVVAWSPVGECVSRAIVGGLTNAGHVAWAAPAVAASRGAYLAASALERGETPWFDHLEGFYLRYELRDRKVVRKDEQCLIDERSEVRAGEVYRTPPDHARRVSDGLRLEEKKSELLIPLRKGMTRCTERIDLETTTQDHYVQIVAVQQPASGYARIEISSETYAPWREDPKRVVFRADVSSEDLAPDLVRFLPAEEAWWGGSRLSAEARSLCDLAKRCREAARDEITPRERNALYLWLAKPRGQPPVHQRYALGTEGELPPANEETGWTEEQRVRAGEDLDFVLDAGVGTLHERHGAERVEGRASRSLNQLHTVASWTFRRCPPSLLDLLLDAVEGNDRSRATVCYEDYFSRRAILHGLGRTVADQARVRRAIAGALDDRDEPFECDALACLSHLMARRRAASEIVNRRREWVQRLAERACDKVLELATHRSVPEKRQMRPHLQMRYALLLLGGLARVRSMQHLELLPESDTTRRITTTLESCDAQGIWGTGKMKDLAGVVGELLALYRGQEVHSDLLYRLMPQQGGR